MKRLLLLSCVSGLSLLIICGMVSAESKARENFWISGRVAGNIHSQVITLELVSISGSTSYETVTSVNKYGWYAFSDEGQGDPSNFKLVVYKGKRVVKEVSLSNVKRGGRVPDIRIP